ncbi:MAG: hypothetical protein AAF664_22740 [Planctomycetota bacterium]
MKIGIHMAIHFRRLLSGPTFLATLLVTSSLAEEGDHPSIFLEKGDKFSFEEFDGDSLPKTIELRGGSNAKVVDGVLTVVNESNENNSVPRPVIHFKPIPEEFVCHIRMKMIGEDYKPKPPWLDIGGGHRNHFRFTADKVFFSSEEVPLSERKIDNARAVNMLPLNEWLDVTIEIEKGKIGLSINGVTQIYEEANIETSDRRQIGIKAIPKGQLLVDYIRIWQR